MTRHPVQVPGLCAETHSGAAVIRAVIHSLFGYTRSAAATAARIALIAIALAAGPSAAVIIESGDGTGNTEAPPDDPGWRNVAYRGSECAVYLRDRWVITARHVGPGDVTIDAENYTMQPGSRVIVVNAKQSASDLVLFQIDRKPPVPEVWISQSRPPIGTPLVLIGQGPSRGPAFRFGSHAGFRWGPDAPMRWGTSEITSRLAIGLILGTETFPARFSYVGSRHESIAARGDSGGAAFVRGADRWELAGILLAVGGYPDQPSKTVLYGNQTYIADLSVYRDQIHRIMRGDPARLPAAGEEP